MNFSAYLAVWHFSNCQLLAFPLTTKLLRRVVYKCASTSLNAHVFLNHLASGLRCTKSFSYTSWWSKSFTFPIFLHLFAKISHWWCPLLLKTCPLKHSNPLGLSLPSSLSTPFPCLLNVSLFRNLLLISQMFPYLHRCRGNSIRLAWRRLKSVTYVQDLEEIASFLRASSYF